MVGTAGEPPSSGGAGVPNEAGGSPSVDCEIVKQEVVLNVSDDAAAHERGNGRSPLPSAAVEGTTANGDERSVEEAGAEPRPTGPAEMLETTPSGNTGLGESQEVRVILAQGSGDRVSLALVPIRPSAATVKEEQGVPSRLAAPQEAGAGQPQVVAMEVETAMEVTGAEMIVEVAAPGHRLPRAADWLPALLSSTSFFKKCARCSERTHAGLGDSTLSHPPGGLWEKDVVKYLSLTSADARGVCDFCLKDHVGHHVIRIRRGGGSNHPSVIPTAKLSKLVDISGIRVGNQNSDRVVDIHTMPPLLKSHSQNLTVYKGRCLACDRLLKVPYCYCSLECKVKHCTGGEPLGERLPPGLELKGQPRDFGHYEEFLVHESGVFRKPKRQESSEDGEGSSGSDAAEEPRPHVRRRVPNVMRPRCRKDKNGPGLCNEMCCLKLSIDELSAETRRSRKLRAAQVTRSQAGRSGRKQKKQGDAGGQKLSRRAKECIDVAMSLGMDFEDQLSVFAASRELKCDESALVAHVKARKRVEESFFRELLAEMEEDDRDRSQDSKPGLEEEMGYMKRLADQGIREDEEMDECLAQICESGLVKPETRRVALEAIRGSGAREPRLLRNLLTRGVDFLEVVVDDWLESALKSENWTLTMGILETLTALTTEAFDCMSVEEGKRELRQAAVAWESWLSSDEGISPLQRHRHQGVMRAADALMKTLKPLAIMVKLAEEVEEARNSVGGARAARKSVPTARKSVPSARKRVPAARKSAANATSARRPREMSSSEDDDLDLDLDLDQGVEADVGDSGLSGVSHATASEVTVATEARGSEMGGLARPSKGNKGPKVSRRAAGKDKGPARKDKGPAKKQKLRRSEATSPTPREGQRENEGEGLEFIQPKWKTNTEKRSSQGYISKKKDRFKGSTSKTLTQEDARNRTGSAVPSKEALMRLAKAQKLQAEVPKGPLKPPSAAQHRKRMRERSAIDNDVPPQPPQPPPPQASRFDSRQAPDLESSPEPSAIDYSAGESRPASPIPADEDVSDPMDCEVPQTYPPHRDREARGPFSRPAHERDWRTYFEALRRMPEEQVNVHHQQQEAEKKPRWDAFQEMSAYDEYERNLKETHARHENEEMRTSARNFEGIRQANVEPALHCVCNLNGIWNEQLIFDHPSMNLTRPRAPE